MRFVMENRDDGSVQENGEPVKILKRGKKKRKKGRSEWREGATALVLSVKIGRWPELAGVQCTKREGTAERGREGRRQRKGKVGLPPVLSMGRFRQETGRHDDYWSAEGRKVGQDEESSKSRAPQAVR